MRNSILSISILLLVFFPGGERLMGQVNTPLTMTFSEAYRQMQENSHVIKQSGFLVKEKEAERKASLGIRMPRISFMASAVKMADPLELDLTPVRDAINPLYSALGNYGVFSGVPNPDPTTASVMPILPDNISTQAVRASLLEGQKTINEAEWVKTIQNDQFAALQANVLWPLYTGGKINAAMKASKIEKEEAELDGQLKQTELFSELVTQYYGQCLAQQAVKVRQQVLEAMQKHLYDSEKLSEQGQIAKVQLLHAQVAVSDAERELNKSKRELEIIERALQNTLAIEESVPVTTVSPLFILTQIEDESYFIQLAIENNTHLKLIDSKRELAGVGVQYEKSNYLPTVALTGMYDLANKDLSPYIPDWTVGVGLKWTLFEGNSRYRKLQSAKYKQDQVEEAGLKAQEDIFTGIRKYHQELTMQSEQLEGLNKTLEFATAYQESQKKAFSEGIASSSDLVDANLLVAKVRIDRLQAMYKFDTVLASLLQLCGSPQLFTSYQLSEQVINESL